MSGEDEIEYMRRTCGKTQFASDDVLARMAMLEQTRDELLAAAKKAMYHFDNVHTSSEDLMQATEDLRTAIAKVEATK